MFSINKSTQLTRLKPNIYLLERLMTTQTAAITNDFQSAADYKSIPRPNIIGFFRDFMPGGKFSNSSFFDYAVKMRERFGDIFVMPGLFGRPDMVMVYNTKDIETVFRNEGQWPTRPILDSIVYYRTKYRGDFFGDSVGLPVSQDEQWGKLRTAVNPILMKPRNMGMYLKPLQNINDEFILRIKEVRNPKTLEVPGNFDNDLNRLAFESVAIVALNRELGLIRKARNNPDAERLFQCTRESFALTYKLDIQPSLWKIIKTPNFYKSMKIQDDIFRITNNYIQETLKDIEEKQKKGELNEEAFSILERLLVMDKKIAVVTAMDLLFAGVDATSVTIIAILLCLAKHPEKQQKLREEVLQILPTKDTELTETNMKSLPYLRAVIKEALRYYPNGNGPVRNASTDLVLAGYKIPKGTSVTMNSNLLLKDDAFYSRAKEFLPERWLRDENNKKMDFDPFTYLPFGMGKRICIGKRLVEMELEVTIMKLIRNFEIEFNYDASKPFKALFINAPGIPLPFKFTDIEK